MRELTLLRPLLLVAGLASMVLAGAARAGGTPPVAEMEVAHLLAYLEKSPCKFGRNGDWHSGAQAAKHLGEKKNYLTTWSSMESAEVFIAKAATKSSVTGAIYQVQCPGMAVMESAPFLTAELARYRQAHKK